MRPFCQLSRLFETTSPHFSLYCPPPNPFFFFAAFPLFPIFPSFFFWYPPSETLLHVPSTRQRLRGQKAALKPAMSRDERKGGCAAVDAAGELLRPERRKMRVRYEETHSKKRALSRYRCVQRVQDEAFHFSVTKSAT